MRVGVFGASGYIGGEILRLLLLHPRVEVTYATSRQYKGEYVYRVHPNLRGFTQLRFTMLNPDEAASHCDLVFTSVPHGTSIKFVPSLVERGLSIIDLSADFRLKNPEDYVAWYGYEHPHPDLLQNFVYGVPELHREEIRSSRLVACPGCIAVASILGLAPAVKEKAVEVRGITIDAKIGSSAAGIKPHPSTHHPERFGVVRAYKPVGHRHIAEIEQELAIIAGEEVRVSMSPHAVNMVRGILTTIYTSTSRELSTPELWRMFRSFYRGESFVRIVKDRRGLYKLPDPKMLVGSNYCDVGFELDKRGGRLILFSAIDNLMKGAAGSAVQCMNLMYGFDERLGLESPGLHPV